MFSLYSLLSTFPHPPIYTTLPLPQVAPLGFGEGAVTRSVTVRLVSPVRGDGGPVYAGPGTSDHSAANVSRYQRYILS